MTENTKRCTICDAALEPGLAVRDAAGNPFCPTHAALADAPPIDARTGAGPTGARNAWSDPDARQAAFARPKPQNHTTAADLTPTADTSTEGILINPRADLRKQAAVPLRELDADAASGGIYDLAEPATISPVPTRGCGNCGQLIDPSVRLCIHCGFDRLKGKQLATLEGPPIEPEGPRRPRLLDADAPWRQRPRGWSLGAVVGAVTGLCVWWIVAFAASEVVGIMVWLVGITTGLAVAIVAQERACTLSGAIAMAVSGVAIAIGRIVLSTNLPAKTIVADLRAVDDLLGGVPRELLTLPLAPTAREFHFMHTVGLFGAVFMLLALFSAYLLGKGLGRVW